MQITSGDFVSVIALNPSIFGSRLRALYTVHNVYRHIEAVWKIALQKPGKLGGGGQNLQETESRFQDSG